MTFEEAARNLGANARLIRETQDRRVSELFGVTPEQAEQILAEHFNPAAERAGERMRRGFAATIRAMEKFGQELGDEVAEMAATVTRKRSS